jgi:hypothetical protein
MPTSKVLTSRYVRGRDAVILKTVYKSPTAIHVFSFSADDPHLFPSIPPVEQNIIRTQIDLQGWAIESLSPTTTLLTLLEQSDPKGWTNKTSIPQQMINSVAGVGEFAIKCGGPPAVTRLAGAKANQLRYDHERGSFKVEYEGSASRRNPSPSDGAAAQSSSPSIMQMPVIECELRCDIDTWASSLDIVVDPPPQSITCLRRHRLSMGGGGLWLTLTHDAVFVDDERLLAIVRRGPGKEKGLVMLNGAKITIDVEELSEAEIKALSKKKRVKPARIPLDQPPVMSVIRRRRAEWNGDNESSGNSNPGTTPPEPTSSGWVSTPKLSSPLTRFFTNAVEQAASTTQQAVAAITPATHSDTLSASKTPMQYALSALSWLQETHCRYTPQDWALVTDKGLPVHRRLCPDISPSIPVHRGQKVIEGVSAEELACIVTQYECRRQWDDRFDSAFVLEAYGVGCHASFVVSKGGFPFRDRGFYVAFIKARSQPSPANSQHRNSADPEQPSGCRNAIFCVSSSFSPDSVSGFSSAKYNPYSLPTGRVFVDGWIFETLDPYTTEKYAIPSTRCTRFVAVDFAGSIPAAVNSVINTALSKSILAVEAYVKTISPIPAMRLPAPGFLLSEAKPDEGVIPSAWKMRRRDEQRLLIMSRYSPAERVYRSYFSLAMPSSESRSPPSNVDDVTTPRPSMIRLRVSSTAKDNSSPPPANAPSFAHTSSSSTTSIAPNRELTSSPSKILLAAPARRPSASAFTVRGGIRHSTDLLVAEVVVDSRLYPEGYDIRLRSHIRDNGKRVSLEPLESNGHVGSILPFSYNVYTLPVSPLHSSGLNNDRSTRQLVRLWLPTAQYQISTVLDPLTGEMQAPPPTPQWLINLRECGAIVELEIRPGSKESVSVDGERVVVLNEKESLTSLGRDELLDDRISRTAVLSR